jgi:hypothetical protein
MWIIVMTGSSALEAPCNERRQPVSALEALTVARAKTIATPSVVPGMIQFTPPGLLACAVCSQPAPGSLLAMISRVGRWETILGP